MKTQLTLFVFIMTFALTACFVEDKIIVLPPTAGDILFGQAAMTQTYKYQIYYDLNTNTTVKTNIFSEWDLGFSSTDTSWNIVLNNAKNMSAGNSLNTNFADITSANGIEMHFDKSDGNPDSLATAGWFSLSGETPVSNNYVYVIDRGFDENYSNLSYKKIVFETPVDHKYKIKFSDLDGQNEQTLIIEKDSTVNYVCFSFDNGIVDVEPNKNEWSLLFTLYKTLYPDDDGNLVPYNVRGALLNPHHVSANFDTLLVFNDITIEDVKNIEFKTDLDIIGFDWKVYDFDNAYYNMVPNRYYIIKNNDNYYYKLKFTGFYNEINEPGYPTFEFARL